VELDPQLIAALVLVGFAALYVGRRLVREWSGRGNAGCAGGCGCSAAVQPPKGADKRVLVPLKQITVQPTRKA
jgi:hypothetical protein